MNPYDEERELLNDDAEDEADVEVASEAEAFSRPSHSPVSGLYARSIPQKISIPLRPAPTGIRPIRKEEIRLDVDGRYPQMTVSGTISGFLVARIHWIAELTKVGSNRWQGTIWYKDGAVASFPYTDVEVRAIGSPFPAGRKLKIKFTGGGATKRTVAPDAIPSAPG